MSFLSPFLLFLFVSFLSFLCAVPFSLSLRLCCLSSLITFLASFFPFPSLSYFFISILPFYHFLRSWCRIYCHLVDISRVFADDYRSFVSDHKWINCRTYHFIPWQNTTNISVKMQLKIWIFVVVFKSSITNWIYIWRNQHILIANSLVKM